MNNRIRGAFEKIYAEDMLKQKTVYFLHEKIRQQNVKRNNPRLRLAAVCASFILFFIIGGFSYNLYFTPNAYVDIDVNPSIELVVNRFGRVIEADPYNDDGASILEDVSVQHMNYDDAVDKLIDVMIANGYLKQNGLLSVTVQTSDGNRESLMIDSLQSGIDDTLQTHHASATINVFSVSEEVKTHAHENRVTPAMYLAISELQKVDSTTNFDDCRDHNLSEINQMLQEYSGNHQGENPVSENNEQQNQPTDDEHKTEDNHKDNNHDNENKNHY